MPAPLCPKIVPRHVELLDDSGGLEQTFRVGRDLSIQVWRLRFEVSGFRVYGFRFTVRVYGSSGLVIQD
jgi:hypothetical protein